MRVETYKQGKKWGYRVKKGNTVVGRSRRLYPSQKEAATVGKNHKQAIVAGVNPRTGK